MHNKRPLEGFCVRALFLLVLAGLPGKAGADGGRIMPEHVPDETRKAIDAHYRRLGEYLPPDRDSGLGFVIDRDKTWSPGAIVRVAFRGGNQDLYRKIAEAAAEWTKYANLQLDFGSPGAHREWSLADTSAAADIRIGFDDGGYWSVIGTEALALAPGESSMNLEDFDFGLPPGWRSVVLHEFGHALGFLHEHQHPRGTCDKEFRWYDDAEYVPKQNEQEEFIENDGKRPGLYTVLGGAPNYWDGDTVDFNLRQLPQSHAFEIGAFDPQSIMKYSFPAWMFVDPGNSKCYSPIENRELSQGNKDGAVKMYPRAAARVKEILEERSRYYQGILANPRLPDDLRRYVSAQLASAQGMLASAGR